MRKYTSDASPSASASLETVISYLANSVNPDGVRAQEVVEALR